MKLLGVIIHIWNIVSELGWGSLLSAFGEFYVGFGGVEGGGVVAAAFVEGCEGLVGVDTDEALDASCVESYRGIRVGAHRRFVTLDGRFVAVEGIFFGPYPVGFLRGEA